MTPDLERFLDLATRPLASVPGECEEAKGELMARVAHGGVPLDLLNLDEPLERLASSKPANPVMRRVSMLGALLLLIGAVGTVVVRQAMEMALLSQAAMISMMAQYGGSYGANEDSTSMLTKYAQKQAPDLPLGLNWDSHGRDETEDWLLRAPDDLALFQEHVSRRIRGGGSPWTGLNEDEKNTIARLDPDNALWSLMQVMPHLARATGSPGSSYYGGYYGGSGSVTVEPEFENALRNFAEAAEKTVYHDRSLSLKRRQLDAFSRSRAITDDRIAVSFAEMVSSPFGRYSNGLVSLVTIQCERLVKAADKEGLAKLFGEWQQLTRIIAAGEPVDVSQGGVVSQLGPMGAAIADAFDKLGMPAEKAEAERWQDALNKSVHSMLTPGPEIEKWAGARMNGLQSIPGDLTAAEVVPSRQTELAYLNRTMGAFLSILALIFTGLVGLETCRRARMVKGMARGLMPLFRSSDHLWIGGLGLAFPWLWWWTITRLSPLGMRDVKFDEWQMLVLLLQPIAGFTFGLVMLLQTARWRWGVRGGFIGLRTSLNGFGWLIAGLTGLAVPAAGMIRYLTLNDDQTGYFLLGVTGMVACGLLWLLWEGVMNLFTPKASSLRANLAMRVLLPWSLAGVLTLMIGVGVSTAMERYWCAKDPLLPNWTSETHMNALEERAAAGFHEAMKGL